MKDSTKQEKSKDMEYTNGTMELSTKETSKTTFAKVLARCDGKMAVTIKGDGKKMSKMGLVKFTQKANLNNVDSLTTSLHSWTVKRMILAK